MTCIHIITTVLIYKSNTTQENKTFHSFIHSFIPGKWKAIMNIVIYICVVTAFLMQQIYVERIKFLQKKSQTNGVITTGNGNELVLQKSGDLTLFGKINWEIKFNFFTFIYIFREIIVMIYWTCKTWKSFSGVFNWGLILFFLKNKFSENFYFHYTLFFIRKLFQSVRLYIKGIVRSLASKCAWQINT